MARRLRRRTSASASASVVATSRVTAMAKSCQARAVGRRRFDAGRISCFDNIDKRYEARSSMKAPFGTATRSDLWLAVALAAAVIVGTAIDAARRVVEILPNRDVPVEVYFESQQQAIAITGLTEPVRVDLDHAMIRVS